MAALLGALALSLGTSASASSTNDWLGYNGS